MGFWPESVGIGVKPEIGRVFNSKEDDQVYQGHPVVVLSYGYWTTRFASDPGVVGRKIFVNNYPMTIVGVSAKGFAGLDPAQAPQFRVPILMKETMLPEWGWLDAGNRRARWVQVFARLKPGYTVESAAAPVQATAPVPAPPKISDANAPPPIVPKRRRVIVFVSGCSATRHRPS